MGMDEKMQTIIDKARESYPYLRMCQTAIHHGIHENPDFCRLELSIKNGRVKTCNLLTQWDHGFISFETFMKLCGVSLEPDTRTHEKRQFLIEEICAYKHNELQAASDEVATMVVEFWKKAPLSLLQSEVAHLDVN